MTAAARFGSWIIDADVDAGTTLRRMAKLCDRAMLDPRVIHIANEVIADVAPRDVPAQIHAIGRFMDSTFKFVDNPTGTQAIRPPGFTGDSAAPGMLEDIAARGFTQGACDDAAVLVATLGMGNGIDARFRALAFWPIGNGRIRYTHVIADLWDGAWRWISMDVTRPFDMARPSDSEIAKYMIYNVTSLD